MENEKQAFEEYPKLANLLEHAANFWLTDNRWSELLEEINKICELKQPH